MGTDPGGGGPLGQVKAERALGKNGNGGRLEGARSESPYVVSYKYMVGRRRRAGFGAYWPGFRLRLRGGGSEWKGTGGVTLSLIHIVLEWFFHFLRNTARGSW